MTDTRTKAQRASLLHDIDEARDALARACNRGSLRMSIPASPEDDDLTISRGLDVAATLLNNLPDDPAPQPTPTEQVANALRQWHDEWSAPDQADADREARIAEWMRRIAAAQFRSDSIALANAVSDGADMMRTAPASRSVSDLLAEVSRLTTERNEALAECDRLRVALDEREGDMHVRIRAGYDKTVADSWRAEVERLTRERDEARAAGAGHMENSLDWRLQRDEARAELDRERGGWDALVWLRDEWLEETADDTNTAKRCEIEGDHTRASEIRQHIISTMGRIDEINTLLAARPAKGEERTDG